MKLIPLTQGKFAKVSDHRFEYLNQWKWCVSKSKGGKMYAYRWKKDCGFVKMHREIMDTPKGIDVDHIDGDGLNNQDENLRNCTHSQNSMNTKGRGRTSKYRGVSFNKASGKWVVLLRVDGKVKWIGSSTSEIEAARIHDDFVFASRGEFAVLNFPRAISN